MPNFDKFPEILITISILVLINLEWGLILEIFEGKSGFRLFKRKKDAVLVAERNNEYGGGNFRIHKVRILNESLAKKSGVSVRADLSIAARSPKKDDIGWVVLNEDENLDGKIMDKVEFLQT